MLIYDGEDEITDYTIIDQITLNWAPSSEIIWTHGKRLVHRLHERDALYTEIDPLAARVRRRALKGFGCVKNVSIGVFFFLRFIFRCGLRFLCKLR